MRGKGGDDPSPVAFANQPDLGMSRPRPCRVRWGDLNNYEFSSQPSSNEKRTMTAKLPIRNVLSDRCESWTSPKR